MPDKPTTDEEWTTHSLNIQGNFFQRLCADIIYQKQQDKCRLVATEYPVEYPPSEGEFRNHESRLDIYAKFVRTSYYPNSDIHAAIECKKNNPDFVDWIFFKSYPPKSSAYYDLLTVESHPLDKDNWTYLFHVRRLTTQQFIFADEARETRGTYQGYNRSDKTKTANDAIESACNQVVLATHSIAYKQHEIAKKADKRLSGLLFRKCIFMPIVVTTANLVVCEYSPSDVSIDKGELPLDKASFSRVDSLIFEYPIPLHLQIKSDDWETYQQTPEPEMLFRRHVFIVNSLHFSEMLDWIFANREYLLTD